MGALVGIDVRALWITWSLIVGTLNASKPVTHTHIEACPHNRPLTPAQSFDDEMAFSKIVVQFH